MGADIMMRKVLAPVLQVHLYRTELINYNSTMS